MILIQPKSDTDFEKYFELRWRILRKPWNEPQGTEQDTEEESSYHIMSVVDSQTIHRPTGVARLQFIEPTIAQLRYMAIEDTLQGKGIGKAIVKHMEAYAREKNATQLFLHARENAVGFYAHLGYETIEPSYLLFDCIQHFKMQKTL